MQMSQSANGGLRLLALVLGIVLLVLQGRLWLSEEGWSEVLRLRASVAAQTEENAMMAERNARLHAEVADLKEGFAALEERARADLGMVGEQESFYLLLQSPAAGGESDD